MNTHPPWPQTEVCNRLHSYNYTNMQMLKKSSCVSIYLYFLLWLELGRVTKRHTKGKRVIKKWSLDRFEGKEFVIRYKKSFQYCQV